MPITIKRKGFGLITTAKEWIDYHYQVWNLNDYIIIKRSNQSRKLVKIPDNRKLPIDDKVSFIFDKSDLPIQYTNNQSSDILNQYKHYKHLLTGWLIGHNLKRLLTWSEYPKLFIMGNDKEREALISNLQSVNSNIPINPEDIIQSTRPPKRKDSNIILIDTQNCTETTNIISNITIPIIDKQNDIQTNLSNIQTKTTTDDNRTPENINYESIIYLSTLYNPPTPKEVKEIFNSTPTQKLKTIASQYLSVAVDMAKKGKERENIVFIPQIGFDVIRIKTGTPQAFINLIEYATLHNYCITTLTHQELYELLLTDSWVKTYRGSSVHNAKINGASVNCITFQIPKNTLNLYNNSTGE